MTLGKKNYTIEVIICWDVVFIKRFIKSILTFFILIAFTLTFGISSFASTSSSVSKSETGASEAAKAEVFEASISRLAELMEGGAITSYEICKVYIERIEKYDKAGIKLNSIISLNTNALSQAEQLDRERKAGNLRGVLHGVPILVKDNIDVSGFPTTLGKNVSSDEVANEDAAAVLKLVEQGAIILGKTNLSTNDLSTRYTVSQLLGETRNAYNVDFAAGGSSGGSAVAVSANFAAAALATDTNFSMLYPAALNGVVAVRPTHSLVDYTGCAKVNLSRDVVGPVAKNVADAALMLDVLTDNSHSLKYLSALKKDALSGKKLLVIKELSQYTYNSPNEFKSSDKEITALFDKAVEDLKTLGAEVETVSIPSLFKYYNNCKESLSTSDSNKAKYLAEVKKLLEDKGADAFIFPAYLSTPLSSGFSSKGVHNAESQNYLNCTGYFPSILGLPAVSVPMGALKSGVSTGLEFVGLKETEAELLSLAYSFEQGTKNRVAPQTVKNLYKNGEIIFNKPEVQKPTAPDVQEEETNQNSDYKPFPWQTVAVVIIIISVLAVCSSLLISGGRRRRKREADNNPNHRHRRF